MKAKKHAEKSAPELVVALCLDIAVAGVVGVVPSSRSLLVGMIVWTC